LRPVRGRINCPNSIVQGDTADIDATVENPGRTSLRLLEIEIPVGGAIAEIASARALLMQLAPGATRRLAIRTPPLRRGYHPVGPVIASSGFPLGLVTRSLTVPDTARAIWVYP